MRRITNNEYGAQATQGATAPMRRIRRGVYRGVARADRGRHDTPAALPAFIFGNPMSTPDLPAATTELIGGVLALIGMPRGDPHYREKALAVLGLASTTLEAIEAAPAENTGTATVAPTGPGNIGLRIAELAGRGQGARAIARQLGVHPSTVSRRLRRA